MPALDVEQVLALAPDTSSAAAGRALSNPARWSEVGTDESGDDGPPALWGLCAGSGKTPYQTVVDLSGPAFRCSCPSRKFPCKHAIGLMLVHAGGAVPAGAVPGWASAWLTQRSAKASAAVNSQAAAPKAVSARSEATAHRRAAERQARLADGVAELERWLVDQVRVGLASLEGAGKAPFEAVAARMVDAGAPGLAASLRELPAALGSGEGWAERLLEGMAMLHLTASAHSRLESLPEPLAASVRREVGVVVPREEVLATPGVRDVWQVLGVSTTQEGKLEARRAWVRGRASERWALLLTYARGGAGPAGAAAVEAGLSVGATIEADLHFYPGAAPLRAVVGQRHDDHGPLGAITPAGPLDGGSVEDARAAFAAAVAADPWTRSWPAVVTALVPSPGAGRTPVWTGHAAGGAGARLLGSDESLWRLLAVSGGHPTTTVVVVEADGVRPSAAVLDDEVIGL